jgi:hypothetical protein
MAIRNDFAPGEVLAAADLNDTFGSKLDLAGGKILQIVRATDSTLRSTTSTSFVDANLSVTITPQRNTSAILLLVSIAAQAQWTTATNTFGRFVITDSSNNALPGATLHRFGVANISGSGTRNVYIPVFIVGRDTPATINATTYKLRFVSEDAGVTIILQNSDNAAQMYAIEVSA